MATKTAKQLSRGAALACDAIQQPVEQREVLGFQLLQQLKLELTEQAF
jgi:hypothetical protein